MVDYGQLHDRNGAPRIRGDSGILFVVNGVDYWADIVSCRFSQEDKYIYPEETDAPVANVGKRQAQITAIQSTAPGSFWKFLWSHEFRTVDFVYAPHGNTTPSEEQPFLLATAYLPSAPEVGGEAGEHNEYTFDVVLNLEDKPALVTSPGDMPSGAGGTP